MSDFIKKIVESMNAFAWMWVLLGVVALVFVFGILMMIIKKRAFPVGISTAIATVLAATAYTYIALLSKDLQKYAADISYFLIFIIGAGSILALIGGFISMIVKKKKRKCECADNSSYNPPASNGYYGDNASPYDYSADSYTPPVYAPVSSPAYQQPAYQQPVQQPAYGGGYAAPAAGYSSASPEVEALLIKINRIVASGAPLPEMRETAMQLQRERAKPENKNNPDTYAKLNKALIDLLGVIQKK